jgi:hypothetical protein
MNPCKLILFTAVLLPLSLAAFTYDRERQPEDMTDTLIECVERQQRAACLAVISAPDNFSYRISGRDQERYVCTLPARGTPRVCFSSSYLALRMVRDNRVDQKLTHQWLNTVTNRG